MAFGYAAHVRVIALQRLSERGSLRVNVHLGVSTIAIVSPSSLFSARREACYMNRVLAVWHTAIPARCVGVFLFL
jgi:hypothetical protein